MRNTAAEKLLGVTHSTGVSLADDDFATYMDEHDPLRDHRNSFHIPQMRDGGSYAYLVGNSIGLQHVDVAGALNGFLKKWQQQGAEAIFMQPNPWFEMDEALRPELGSLVGAYASEVVLMNSSTVNLHLLLSAFYKPNGAKRKFMMENQGYPSNTHALVSQLQVRGFDPKADLITVAASGHEDWRSPPAPVPTETFLAAIERHGSETAVLVLSAIHFLTGQFFDIPTIVRAAHEKNILVGLDCSQAAGNVPLQLHNWEVDFAFWCTYKYLGGSPGGVAAAFVHSKHTLPGSGLKHLKGWWGNERKSRFSLCRGFEPSEGAGSFQVSACDIAGVTSLIPSVKLMSRIGIEALREKSLQLTAYLELLLNELIPPGCIDIVTPANPASRGAQLSISILPNKLKSDTAETEGYDCGGADLNDGCDAVIVQRQLLDLGVMVDYRPPDVIRIAPAPLYNSYTDVLLAVRALSSLF